MKSIFILLFVLKETYISYKTYLCLSVEEFFRLYLFLQEIHPGLLKIQ